MLTFQLWLTDDNGVRLAPLNDILNFSATRQVNAIGPFVGQLKSTFDTDLLRADNMIQVWYAPSGGKMGFWRAYFIRKWRFETKGANRIIRVWGKDHNDLLRRRIVAAYSASSYATKNDYADDMMKEIVSEALSNALTPANEAGTRAWSDLSIAGDLSLGPTITTEIGWKYLLKTSGAGVLPDISQTAKDAGNEVFFDIIPDVVSATSLTFRFETTINQPGQDLTGSLVFDQRRGNLRDPFLEYDYTDEENYIYVGGQSIASFREIDQVYDAARYGASKWNRCEGFTDARTQTSNGVTAAGQSALVAGEPKIRMGGTPVDTRGTRFGIDWNFGDKVTARYENREFSAIIRAVALGKNEKGDTNIQARLEYES